MTDAKLAAIERRAKALGWGYMITPNGCFLIFLREYIALKSCACCFYGSKDIEADLTAAERLLASYEASEVFPVRGGYLQDTHTGNKVRVLLEDGTYKLVREDKEDSDAR